MIGCRKLLWGRYAPNRSGELPVLRQLRGLRHCSQNILGKNFCRLFAQIRKVPQMHAPSLPTDAFANRRKPGNIAKKTS